MVHNYNMSYKCDEMQSNYYRDLVYRAIVIALKVMLSETFFITNV